MPNFEDWSGLNRISPPPAPGRHALASSLLAAGLLAATACSAATSESGTANDGRPTVLASFTVLADMTRNVAGDAVRVESLTRVGAEIHGYEPTPEDLVRGRQADLILENGLGLETWFQQFTERVEAPTVVVSEGVETIPISSGEHQGAPNPHAWMSPDNALVYVDNISQALSELDPGNTDSFQDNAEHYKDQIREVGHFLTTELSALPEHQRALVTCEGAFSYLARDAGLQEYYLWPVNAESEGTPRQIAAVTQFVRDNEVPAVFCESTVNGSAQQAVVRETGAAMGRELYVDSLSEADGPVPTYLDLLRYDAEAIVAGLTGQQESP